MHQDKGFKFCLDTRNNKALPFDPVFYPMPSDYFSLNEPHLLAFGMLVFFFFKCTPHSMAFDPLIFFLQINPNGAKFP
jgi:hypothetical protein